MLEQMRQKGASIFIYLIFGLLIVIFVINFAPSGQGSGGCRTGSTTVVDVDGDRVNENAYKIAYSSPFNEFQARQKVYYALETVIRRELLAAAAEDRGIRVNRDMVYEEVKKGYFFTGGARKDVAPMIFDVDADGDRTWNLNKFRGLVRSLDVSQNAYLEEQTRGLQATLMAELLASSAQVSRDEALSEYLFDNNTVTYDVLTFQPALYRAAMLLTDADVERFLAAHEDQVKARYKEKESEYVDRKPELKLRQIFIAKAEPAAKPEDKKPDDKAGDKKPDDKAGDKKDGDKKADDKKADDKAADAKKPADAKAADAKAADAKAADAKKPADTKAGAPKAADAKKPDDKKDGKPAEKTAEAKPGDDKKDTQAGAAAKPAGMPVEEAKAKLDAARAAVVAGKDKFAELAKQLNTDPVLKASGGNLGWKTAENPSIGEKVVSDAVKALKPGEMTPVIVGERGVYLVYAEAQREKNLTYDQVKHELAAELARDTWSKEAAKRAALKALEDVRASGRKLDDLYPRELKPGFDLQELQRQLNDPSLTPERRQQLQQQLLEQLQNFGGGDEHGSIVIESADVLAASKAGDGGSAGSPAGGTAPAPAAGTPAPAAGTPAPAAGGTAPAAGTPPAAPLAASSDVLPEFQEVAKPKVRKEGPHPRQKRMPGLDADGAKALFDELSAGQLAPRVFDADGNYTIVQVMAKSQAKIEDFEKDASRIIDRMREQRGAQLVREWLKTRCEQLEKDGKTKPRADKIAEFDDKGKPMPTVYRPCMSLK